MTTALSAMAFGFDATVKATFILALALCLIAGLRRASAGVRHMAATLGLAGALALPISLLFMPRIAIPLLPSWIPAAAANAAPSPFASRDPYVEREASTASLLAPTNAAADRSGRRASASDSAHALSRVDAPFSRNVEASPVVDVETASVPSRVAPPPAARPFAWAPWALAVWAAGAIFAFTRLLLGSLRVRAIARSAVPLRDPEWLAAEAGISQRLQLRGRVRMLTSPEVPVAMTAGARRPVLLLNSSARKWPADRRRVVLLHELAHVRRRDWITLLLVEAAVAVYWFHPLAWFARRQARLNGERACDDLVIGDGTKPSVYAAHLLGIVRSFTPGARGALPVMAMARPSQFEGRMRAILDPGLHRRGPSRGQIRAAALGLFSAVLVLSALAPWAPRDAKASAIPGGFAATADLFPAAPGDTTEASKADRKTDCPGRTPKSGVLKASTAPAPEPAPLPALTAPLPAIDPSGFVRAIARTPALAPEAAPAPPPAAAAAPPGFVLAGNRKDRSGDDWYDRGMTLHRAGRYDDAIAAFRNSIERGYREDAASYNIACGYALKGDKDHAFEWLRKADEAGFPVGRYLGDDDDLDALKSDPRWAALRNEARAKKSRGEIEDARQAKVRFERLLARPKAPKDAFFSSGHDLLKTDDYALAAKAFQHSAEIGYRSGTSYYNAACALALAGEKTPALDSLQKAVENGFDDPSLFRKDDDLASLRGEARFRELQALADDLEMPSVQWGSKIFRSSERKEWRAAADRAREVAARHANLGRVWFNLGYAEIRGERPESAAEAFQKAFDLGYRKPTTLYNLACSYAKLDQKDKAFDFLFRAIEAGFGDDSTIRHDDDLDNLRSDARFRKAERLAEARADDE